MPNFKSKAAYKAWLAYGHASGEFEKTPGNQPVSIKGESHKVKHAGGGKVGDTFKLMGDTLLSTVGLSDVIGDENYRNQGFADASRVGEKIGQQAGQIAGNLILPGMGGQIVSTAQNTLGNLDGEDAERIRIEQMRTNKDSYGKYSDSITDMNKLINPISTGVTIGGTLGNIGATNFMQTGSVLGDLTGLKNSFGQGIFGQTTPQTIGDTTGTAISALSGLPFSSNDINYGIQTDINKLENPSATPMSLQNALSRSGFYGIQTDINKLENPSATPMSLQNALSRSGLNAFGGNMKTKYANGGPITMGEQVVPGSARHKELQALEAKRNAYLQREQDIINRYGQYAGAPISKADFISKYGNEFDKNQFSSIPEGANVYQIDNAYPGGSEEAFFSSPNSGKAFTYGLPSVDIPAYDLMPEDNINMTIQPEKIFSPIEAGVYDHASRNPTTQRVGYSYGYEGQKPESITTVDPYTRERLFRPKSQSFTSGMYNSDFGTIADSLEGVPTQDYMTNPQLLAKTTTPVVSSFAYGGKMNMMPDGGKLPDTADQLYMQQFRDEFDWNTYSKYLPKTGPLPSDQRVEDLGKLPQTTIPDNLEKPIDIRKKLGFAYGGNINMLPDGGKFVEYQGPDHANGGIDVDPNTGLPTMKSNTEVEGGETMHDNGIENYVFSDRLVVNPGDKKKLTFADLSKKINNKYKKSTNDPIAEKSRLLELEQLKDNQEQVRGMMDSDSDGMACGGKMKKPWGGPIIDPNSMYGIAGLDAAAKRSIGGGIPDPNKLFSISGLSGQLPLSLLQSTDTSNVDPMLLNELATKSEHWDKRPLGSGILKSDPNAQPQSEGSSLPQDTINPLGYFASNIGNIYDLTQASKETPKNDFGRANFETVNYGAARTEAEKQAAMSRAIARENARNSTSAGGAMTNRVIANAVINSGLASQLGDSYMQEANANAQIKNQENQINTQIGTQEKIADQQDLAMRLSTTSQALHNIGMNTQGFVRDLKAAEIGNINNKMWFDMVKSGKYSEMVPVGNGNFKTGIRIGNKVVDPNTREVIITYKEGDAEYIKPSEKTSK